ncbi:HAMP domain-containing protein [Aureimonas fodinaquatilis]|uniref:histidine kinase n=1 Tax=Aureimonas fodinaquatilis TaxID=2565783 RepID=A0A5B0E3W0_9HYPH|nr:ATP-binding protein [Aureimonas fodinaquatilis]KAA0972089.1 HAMP domain-containing protein [Aureimonas fodinaquatilis]
MNSIRSRITALLVVAIVGVVVLAAFVSWHILDRPDRFSFANSFAEEVRIVASVLRDDPAAASRYSIAVGPMSEAQDGELSRQAHGIQRILARQGLEIPVVILQDAQATRRLAFEYSPGSWAFLAYPGPPPSAWGPLSFYLSIVVLGALAISLFAATRMTRPLRMLDDAVSSIGPDGRLPHVEERGPVEVMATARALNRLSDRLRDAMESRIRLVAAAGHDLRTPMTRMRLRAEFLPEEERQVWLNDLEELDMIADSAIRLVREEVAGPEGREPVDAGLLLNDIAVELMEIGRSVQVEALLPEVAVNARPLALKRALRNLIDNAALHGGGAQLALATSNGQAVISIFDNGPGIPEELLGRVFEPFFRVDPARRKFYPGAGLGLAIALEIIEQEGGTLKIANRDEGGLVQVVRLPIAAPDA